MPRRPALDELARDKLEALERRQLRRRLVVTARPGAAAAIQADVELERKLAELKGTEDAVVFGSGYLTNVGVISALAGRSDLILMDELCHSSLLTGASASGVRVLEFRHNEVEHAAELLAAERAAHRHCLVLTDGVFSMEGDLAPLPPLAALAAEHDAWLMTDDAHGLGVVGDGRGSSFAFGAPVAIPLASRGPYYSSAPIPAVVGGECPWVQDRLG